MKYVLLLIVFSLMSYTANSSCLKQLRHMKDDLLFLEKLERTPGRIKQGEIIVERMKARVKEIYHTSGIESEQALEDALAKVTKQAAEVRDLIMKEEFTMTVQMNEEKIKNFIKTGKLDNIHYKNPSAIAGESEHNKSYYLNQMVPQRNSVEGNMIGLTAKEYKELPAQLKPTYATIKPKDPKIRASGINYGNVELVLKIKNVKRRMTWSPGDSLGRHGRKIEKAGVSNGTYSEMTPKRWDDFFIPWENNELMVPSLYLRDYHGRGVSPILSGIEHNRALMFTSTRSSEFTSGNYLLNQKPAKLGLSPKDANAIDAGYQHSKKDGIENLGEWPEELNKFNFQPSSTLSYPEIQIWGGLELKDIDYINIRVITDEDKKTFEFLKAQGYDVRIVTDDQL